MDKYVPSPPGIVRWGAKETWRSPLKQRYFLRCRGIRTSHNLGRETLRCPSRNDQSREAERGGLGQR